MIMATITKTEVECPKCHIRQDPEHPVCMHMAGAKGGRVNYARQGREFYVAIGTKGGNTVKKLIKEGKALSYATLGQMGGTKVREKRGRKFYEEIGRKGGETIKAERGSEHYSDIGKKGAESRERIMAAGRKVLDEEES